MTKNSIFSKVFKPFPLYQVVSGQAWGSFYGSKMVCTLRTNSLRKSRKTGKNEHIQGKMTMPPSPKKSKNDKKCEKLVYLKNCPKPKFTSKMTAFKGNT